MTWIAAALAFAAETFVFGGDQYGLADPRNYLPAMLFVAFVLLALPTFYALRPLQRTHLRCLLLGWLSALWVIPGALLYRALGAGGWPRNTSQLALLYLILGGALGQVQWMYDRPSRHGAPN